jgi:hypothetical protein
MGSSDADRIQQTLIAMELRRIRENGERYKNGVLIGVNTPIEPSSAPLPKSESALAQS